jgi:Chitobiase/beta-hexosaminidase C-terminal domain
MIAAPTFDPPGGTFTTAQLVTISCATPGALIYYTIDGTTPDMNSTLYTVPILVAQSETVQAIAYVFVETPNAPGNFSVG